MNLNAEMVPGLCLLLCGALLTFGAEAVCRKKQNATQIRLLGVGMAVIGAILVFLP